MHPSQDYGELAEPLHTLFTTIAEREGFAIQEGLELLTSFVFNEFRIIHAMLLEQEVPHADGRLWQAIAQIAHQLAHAPHGMPLAADDWLHPDLNTEDTNGYRS